MSKKDYILLADALLSARNAADGPGELVGVETAATYVADALARDRGVFQRQKFLKAAGFGERA